MATLDEAVNEVAAALSTEQALLPLWSVANQIGVTNEALYYWANKGKLRTVRLGGRLYINMQEAERWARLPMRAGGIRRRKGKQSSPQKTV